MPKTSNAAWLVPLVLTLACGQTDPSVRAPVTQAQAVVGGHPATRAELRGTVAILWDDVLTCTGTLLTPALVITAAHCVPGANPAAHLKVLANTLTVSGVAASDVHAVQSVAVHAGYPSAGPWDSQGLGEDHDVALLILVSNVTTQQWSVLLPMELVDPLVPANTPVVIAGYGEDGAGNQGVLMAATTPMVRRNATEFIAGMTGQPDTCVGDSGGPVYAEQGGVLLLLGITARGISSGGTLCGDGGIYTLAPAYLEWFRQNSNGLFIASASSGPASSSSGAAASSSGGAASSTATSSVSDVLPYDGNGKGGNYTPGPKDPIGIFRESVGICSCASTHPATAWAGAAWLLVALVFQRRRNGPARAGAFGGSP